MHASAITNILAAFGRQEINAKYTCAMLGNTDNMLRKISYLVPVSMFCFQSLIMGVDMGRPTFLYGTACLHLALLFQS